MKFNKWTLGLAAVGAVSLTSVARADEAHLDKLNTALSNTTISGYVDVAAQYNGGDPGQATAGTPITPNNPFGLNQNKVDNFSLNALTISLDKPLDESPWASGYHADLNWGSDAVSPLTSSSTTSPVRQAYVALRTPVGNGIDWKMGAFDGVTGYEVNTGYANPNYTRSYGYQVNPASELGLIGAYKIVDNVSVQLGIANRGTLAAPNSGAAAGLSSKNYIGTVALTAPESFGFLKGSVLNFGTVQTFDNGGVNIYDANVTIMTPVTGLKFGFAYDAVESLLSNNPGQVGINGNIFGVYACYQATEKLGFNLRGEYVDAPGIANSAASNANQARGEELTATIQYDLWANVVSRLEVRWDHVEHGIAYNNGQGVDSSGNTPASVGDAFLVAINVVYKF